MTRQVAVIGSGLAGLSCARVLRRAGFYVDVFEQDRIIGGRMGTTRLGLIPFDHGAQYLTARSTAFQSYIDEMAASGYAARWQPRATAGGEGGGGQILPWWIGRPGMASLVRPLAESVRIHTEKKVHTLERVEKGWRIWFEDQSSAGPVAAVAVCVPAPDALLLLGRFEDLATPLERVRMAPTWALLVRIDEHVLPDQDVYSDMSEVVRWVARNNSKPGRSGNGDHIVIHAGQAWSREVEDAEAEAVATELWTEVSHLLGLPPIRPAQMAAFLWRRGLVDVSLGETYLFSTEHMVGAAGDWCLGRLSEHAFESGNRLGRAMVDALT